MNSDEAKFDDLKRRWQSQPSDPMEIDMTALRTQARKLETTVRSRNRREIVVAGPLAIFFALVAAREFWSGNLLSGAGGIILVLALGWIVIALRRWGSSIASYDELFLDGMSFVRSYRQELVRQRRLLQFAWLWYCLPMFIGLLLLDFGVAIRQGTSQQEWLLSFRFLSICVLFVAVALLNLFAARQLGRTLHELTDPNQFEAGS